VIVLNDTSSADDRAVSEKGKQVMIVDSSSDEDEDEMEWDEVDLTAQPMSEDVTESETTPATREVTLARTPQKHTYFFNSISDIAGGNVHQQYPATRSLEKPVSKLIKCIFYPFSHHFVT
jgi:hypothetical protein